MTNLVGQSRRTGVILAAAVLLLAATRPLAEQAQKPGAQTPITFRAGVGHVRVEVVVTSGGRPVTGLTEENFEILDNGVPQDARLATTTGDLSILPVLDTSDSVRGTLLAELVGASRALIDNLRPDERAGLVTFGDDVVLQAPLGAVAANRDRIREALGRLRGDGLTAMRDGLSAGLAAAASNQSATALLLFTDGADTASWLTEVEVLDAVKRSDVVVYIVATGLQPEAVAASPDVRRRLEFFSAIAEASGGEVLRVELGRHRLNEEFLRILGAFRRRYVLSYSPQCVPSDEGWHPLTVSLKRADGTVRARTGYFPAGLGASAVAPCQPSSSEYAAIVERYRRDPDGAAIEFGTWSAFRVRQEAVAESLADDPQALAAAALLHADTAIHQVSGDLAGVHFDAASRLAPRLRRRQVDPVFCRTWYLMLESFMIWRDERHGQRFRDLASLEFKDDPEVLLARGTWSELAATRFPGADSQGRVQLDVSRRGGKASLAAARSGRADGPDAAQLGIARECFKAALDIDPGLAEARLRLGRVLFLLGKGRDAAVQLERANREGKDPFLTYLAALFLGQVHESEGLLNQAERWYRSALAVVPDTPSASIALAHLLLTTGRQPEAVEVTRRTLQAAAARPSDQAVDPWRLYDEGQSWRMPQRLAFLRKVVRQ